MSQTDVETLQYRIYIPIEGTTVSFLVPVSNIAALSAQPDINLSLAVLLIWSMALIELSTLIIDCS